MSVQHHGDSDAMKRLIDQLDGRAKRQFPNSRVDAKDDGALSYAIATDMRHRIIRIDFTKPVEWLGLDIQSAEYLRDSLTERILELRTGEVHSA